MTKVKRTYRLEQGTVDKLAELADAEGSTVTDILERAVLAYGPMPDDGHTESHTGRDGDSRAIDALADELARLHSQLDEKDAQIRMLGDALADAQATARGTLALHAASTQALAERSADGRKGLVRRLLDAWRG